MARLSDNDRCILLAALRQLPWHLDALSTAAYAHLSQDAPWAPHRTLEAWMAAHPIGD